MDIMSPVERVLRTLEGKTVDRVPCLCAMMEVKTVNQFLGTPLMSKLIPDEFMLNMPVSAFILDRWGPALSKALFRPSLVKTFHRRNIGQVMMGFDAMWSFYDDSWIIRDHSSYVVPTGAIFRFISDEEGNMSYMYSGPGIKSPEDYDSWPCWPNADEMAQRVYAYYKKFMADYGEKICVCGTGYGYGLQESMNMTFGIDRVPFWIRKHPDYVKRYLDLIEEILIKTHSAMLDAGVPVIFRSDDMAFKTGPFMSPKMIDEVYGERYRRVISHVKQRGGKFILHSCGDNTKLFDTFIGWGVDGLHAYETTSNVDVLNEKKIHGGMVTMIGGMGIDYHLTEMSTEEEVVERVKELIRTLGPGGRFMVAPANCLDSMPARKLQVMLDAVKEFGSYPIRI